MNAPNHKRELQMSDQLFTLACIEENRWAARMAKMLAKRVEHEQGRQRQNSFGTHKTKPKNERP